MENSGLGYEILKYKTFFTINKDWESATKMVNPIIRYTTTQIGLNEFMSIISDKCVKLI